MDNKRHVISHLKVSESVIEKIAEISTLEVEGVASLSHHNQRIWSIFTKPYITKSVVIELENDVAIIHIFVNVKLGYCIPDISILIQNAVKSSVQNMTSIAVSKVNVIIAGIDLEEDQI